MWAFNFSWVIYCLEDILYCSAPFIVVQYPATSFQFLSRCHLVYMTYTSKKSCLVLFFFHYTYCNGYRRLAFFIAAWCFISRIEHKLLEADCPAVTRKLTISRGPSLQLIITTLLLLTQRTQILVRENSVLNYDRISLLCSAERSVAGVCDILAYSKEFLSYVSRSLQTYGSIVVMFRAGPRLSHSKATHHQWQHKNYKQAPPTKP